MRRGSIIVLGMAALAFSACGGSDDGGTSEDGAVRNCASYSTAAAECVAMTADFNDGYVAGDVPELPDDFPALPASLSLCGTMHVTDSTKQGIYAIPSAEREALRDYFRGAMTAAGYTLTEEDKPEGCGWMLNFQKDGIYGNLGFFGTLSMFIITVN